MTKKDIRLAFFGTSEFSVIVLEEMKRGGFAPDLIITTPDKPKGRKLVLTPPVVKAWAQENKVPLLQPEKLKDSRFLKKLEEQNWDVFIVASYGKIIPKEVLELPKKKTLNVHPSLLPKYRGASPLQSQILNDDKETGVTIIRLDEEMDHGPIIATKEVHVEPWPPSYEILEKKLGEEGGKLLVEMLPQWLSSEATEKEQDHSKATFTKKIEKNDGLIDLSSDPYQNFLKFQAFRHWPQTFFFVERKGKKIRAIIKNAVFEDGKFIPKRVVPEGGKEMDYDAFLKGL